MRTDEEYFWEVFGNVSEELDMAREAVSETIEESSADGDLQEG
jgi:hypothetical protein